MSARGRGIPGWLVLLFLVGVVWIVQRQLQVRAARSEYLVVQTDRALLEPGVPWVDPRWEPELRARLASQEDFRPDDGEARGDLRERVEALSFVAEVGQAEVLWPDGVRLDLRLRQPVACVPVGASFYPVGRDGVLLSGVWDAPPPIGPGHLPVLGPLDGGCDALRPGDALEEPTRLDALATAASLLDHLDDPALGLLGRTVIDASRARFASPDEPGLRLFLEEERVVWFGRAANTEEPGELSVGDKWDSLARALHLWDAGDSDWDLVDVRWDYPDC